MTCEELTASTVDMQGNLDGESASGQVVRTSAIACSQMSPHLPYLLILFVGSGCAALIYEVI